MKSTTQWQKNLYENRDLPDNYTDETFLEELRKNIKPSNVTTLKAISLGASVSVELSIVALFVIIFIWLNNEWTTPKTIFISSSFFTALGYFLYTLQVQNLSDRLSKDIRSALIFFAFGYVLSPILKTLTEAISTDTIYAMTIFMFLIHLIFGKYGSPQISLSDSLSITSSIFGSLMLASRLTTYLHAFALLTVAVQCFVLLPFLLKKTKDNIVISISLMLVTIYFLFHISLIMSYVYVAATVLIHCICPLWYIRWQKYKENIYGPWDEAEIPS